MLDPSLYHIIGDSAFPVKNWLIKTPKGLISRSEMKFNKKLSQTRIVVEHAFGDLKIKFRRYQNGNSTIENGVNIVVASCVNHNIYIAKGDIAIPTRNPAAIFCDVNPDRVGNVQNVRGAGNVK